MPQATADIDRQQHRLHHQLAALRRRMRLVVCFRGFCWLFVVLLGTMLADGLLDWHFHLPPLIRAALLVGAVGGAGCLGYRLLLIPLSSRMDDLTLALRVEERHPSLNDSLASTIQFLEAKEGRRAGTSSSIRSEAVRRTLHHIRKYNFLGIVDTHGVRPAALAAGCLAGIILGLAVWQPLLTATVLLRLIDPFGDHACPCQTQLEVDVPRLRIGRNELFEVHGRVWGVIPDQVSILFKHLDGPYPLEYTTEITRDSDGHAGSFHLRLEPGRVQHDFSFQVRAHDAISKEYTVTVLPPPVLILLDGRASPQVYLKYPDYTDIPAAFMTDGVGNIEAVAGTQATLRAAVDRPLSSAWIEFHPEPRYADLALFLAPLGMRHAVGALALTALGQTVWGKTPAQLDADRQVLTVTFQPRLSGTYTLNFEDDTNLRNSRLFELHVLPDPAPTVQVERPSPRRESLSVLPHAELPLQVVVSDPQYAVRSVYLEYRCKKGDPPRQVPLYDHATTEMAASCLLTALMANPVPPPLFPLRLRPQQVPLSCRLNLSQFTHLDPLAGGLKEGDVLTLQVCADDFDDVSVDKQPGRSHEIEIHIVSRNALDLLLNQAQAKMQQELVALREIQRDATKKVAEAQGGLKQKGRLSSDNIDQLLQAQQQQQQIRQRIGNPNEGLQAEVQRILQTLRDNRISRSLAQEHMETVAQALDRLAREELPQIEPRLTNALKQNDLIPDPNNEQGQILSKEQQAQEYDRRAAEQERSAAEIERKMFFRQDMEWGEAKARADALRRKAKEMRDAAQSLRQQVQQSQGRKPTNGMAPAQSEKNRIQDLLNQSQEHQSEIEKTLTSLLEHLEPYSSTREIKGETKAILEEQRQLKQATEELQKSGLLGTSEQGLTEAQRTEVDKLRAAQQKLEERASQLLNKMKRIGEERASKDPQTAQELKEAEKLGRNNNVIGQMREAHEQIAQNQLGKASTSQETAVQNLEQMVRSLEDSREEALDRLVKKLRKAQAQVARLIDEQERLQKKIRGAQQIADLKKREEEVQRLQREQQKLKAEAQELLQQLSRLRNDRAGRALSKAASQMEQAVQQLQQGGNPAEQQEETLDRLDEVQRELERAQAHAEDELAREHLTKISDGIKHLKERQQQLIVERERLQGELARNRLGRRAALSSLGHLAQEQQLLGDDTLQLVRQKLTGAPVVGRLLSKAAQTMQQGSDRLLDYQKQMIQRRPHEADAGAQAAGLQADALRRLNQLFEVLKPEDSDGAQTQGRGSSAARATEGDSIPALAELKLLRGLQAEINQRIEEFTKNHPDPAKLTAADRKELRKIRDEQQEVAQLLDDLTHPASSGGEGGQR